MDSKALLKCKIKFRLNRWLFLPVLFASIILLQYNLSNGMGAGGSDMDDNKTVTVKSKDNGTEIKVKCGDTVNIELEGMGSAGYSWFVDNLDTEHLELLSEKTKRTSEDKIGAPVLSIWQFKTLKKGHAEIKLDHYRKWEGIEKATEHFLIKLEID
jgi:predicted secreted protein